MSDLLDEKQLLPKVLIADNHEKNLKEFEEQLGGLELNLFTASYGQQVVMLAKSHEFALIIMDIHLTGIDSFKTVEFLHYFGHSKHSPIIFITDSTIDEELIMKGYDAGAVDFIFRPVSKHILRSKVKVFIQIFQQKWLINLQKKKLENALENQKKNAEDLKLAQQKAELANRAKTHFLTSMSHEFRTPLSAIIGFNQILINQGQELNLPKSFQKFQENIQNSSKILLELINNILDLSKIEAGKVELAEEIFHLEGLVKQIFDIYRFQATQKGVIFTYEINAKLPIDIYSDRMKLQQILINLVGNAIKFTPPEKKVMLKVTGDQDILAFMVIDEGIGIPKAQQENIFGTFEQADDSITRNYGGTGLGLSITKKLVELLQGKIIVASQGEGRGSNILVRIPLREAPVTATEESVRKSEKVEITNYSFANDNRILIVEDNLMNQDLIKALLQDFGLTLYFANDGEQGVEKALHLVSKGTPPDLILMDMQMPNMDGTEATRQLRASPDLQHIPIVALSANAYSEQQANAHAQGINDYLTKPIVIDKLLAVLQKYLRQ